MTNKEKIESSSVIIAVDLIGMVDDRTVYFEVPKEKEKEIFNSIVDMENFMWTALYGINGEERDKKIAKLLDIKHIETVWDD